MADQTIVERLSRLHPQTIDLSLDRINALLDDLDRPQDKLPPVIHVAGTNGKGSVVAYLRAITEAAGYLVHAYTSPHLLTFNERIRLGGNLITDAQLTALIDECEQINGGADITFFEFTTAVAFLAFSRMPADLVLLETGLGGRLDATNVIKNPALTILTPIAIDHVGFLGDNLEGIAREKAAIMKPGTATVSARQAPVVREVIEDRAEELGVNLYLEGKQWRAERERARMTFRTSRGMRDNPVPRLLGNHQIQNAGIAIASLDVLPEFKIADLAITQGLSGVEWPARLQRLSRGPLTQRIKPGWEIWLDGGHNPLAGRALASVAERWSDQPLYAVVGMLNSKDPKGFLEPLAPYLDGLYCIPVEGEENSLEPEALEAIAKDLEIDAKTVGNPELAIARAMRQADKPGRVLICGSLYLAGKILEDHG